MNAIMEEAKEFDIERIAHTLGMLCRFNGHVSKFLSIAEHRIMVSLLMEEFDLGNPLEGLLHATLLPRNIRENFNLPLAKTSGCQKAIAWSGAIQTIKLMSKEDQGELRSGLIKETKELINQGWIPLNLYPEEATEAFMRRYNVLVPKA